MSVSVSVSDWGGMWGPFIDGTVVCAAFKMGLDKFEPKGTSLFRGSLPLYSIQRFGLRQFPISLPEMSSKATKSCLNASLFGCQGNQHQIQPPASRTQSFDGT